MLNMEKKREKTLVEKTSERIVEFIKERNMRPGDRLPSEHELTNMLEVGRGTLREAIKTLMSHNILDVRQGAGTFVSYKNGIPEDPLGLALEDLDDKLLLDMLEVRMILEPEIAELAAMNATTPQIDELFRQCRQVEDLIKENKSYIQVDALFHQTVAECSGNRIIGKMMPIITSSIQLNVGGTRDQFKKQTITEHKVIAEAIANRDARGAKYAMIAHLNTTRSGISY